MQYSKNPQNFHAMFNKAYKQEDGQCRREEKNRNEFSLQIDLMSTSDKSMEEYLDRYEGIKLELLNTTCFQ